MVAGYLTQLPGRGSHFSNSAFDSNKLGNILSLIGWINFSVHILEFCSEEELILREDYFLNKYLPTLNGKFSNVYSNKIYRTLRTTLKHKQSINREKDDSLYQGPATTFNYKIWVYSSSFLKLVKGWLFEIPALLKSLDVLNINLLLILWPG
jgi:hypothetical protein